MDLSIAIVQLHRLRHPCTVVFSKGKQQVLQPLPIRASLRLPGISHRAGPGPDLINGYSMPMYDMVDPN